MKKFNFIVVVYLLFIATMANAQQVSLAEDLMSPAGIDLVINIIFAVLVSASWSAIKGQRNPDGNSSLTAIILGRCFLGAVVGIIAFAITESYEVDNWLQVAIVGVAAWGGDVIPDTLLVRLIKVISGEKQNDKTN